MTGPLPRAARRRDALSRDRIVHAAIEILDTDGERALTVRSLTSHLATGRGAIYHHVSGVDDLLAAAAENVISAATQQVAEQDPYAALRRLSLAIFDAIDAHPWAGTQLAREPLQPATLLIWKSIGTQLERLGITGPAASDAGAALANYTFGTAAQFAAGARHARDNADRQSYLNTLAAAWIEHDTDQIVNDAAAQLRDHDDRAQFLAGVDIFLDGIATRIEPVDKPPFRLVSAPPVPPIRPQQP